MVNSGLRFESENCNLSANVQGKRLAVAHLLFNVVTAAIALLMLGHFMLLVDVIAEYVGIANDDYTLKLAIFHSLFNLVGVVLMLPFVNKMVAVLEKFLKGEQVKVDEPRYLNDAAMAFPDTVVLAVHQETVRLYKHASHIILKTIGLSSRDVFSDKELAQLLQEHSKINPYNVDAAYERNIKGIYSAIIAFIRQADFTWEMQQSGSLYWLRAANRHIVEAIKDTKHLQKNLLMIALICMLLKNIYSTWQRLYLLFRKKKYLKLRESWC